MRAISMRHVAQQKITTTTITTKNKNSLNVFVFCAFLACDANAGATTVVVRKYLFVCICLLHDIRPLVVTKEPVAVCGWVVVFFRFFTIPTRPPAEHRLL